MKNPKIGMLQFRYISFLEAQLCYLLAAISSYQIEKHSLSMFVFTTCHKRI